MLNSGSWRNYLNFRYKLKGVSVMKEYMSILEGLVEQLTLAAILEMLERICHKKAENLRTHWNDEESAKLWEKAARQIENINVDI
jgi:hypothetical protein